MNAQSVQQLIEAGLPGARVRVQSDDNTHFAAVIVAPQFAGKTILTAQEIEDVVAFLVSLKP